MAELLLLPGAGGDPWYWHLVVARLEGRGHTAVAVDLPAGQEDAGLREYADVAVRAAEGLREVVLVAQSLGAFTAAMVAPRLPVRALAFVNGMIPLPGETPGQWWSATGHAEAQAAARGEHDAAEDFTHDLPPSVVRAMHDRQRDQSAAAFASACTFDTWPRVPIHALVGAEDRFFPAAFQQRLCRTRLGIEPVVVPGGHAIALSQPGAVAGWLDLVGRA
ncbi:alpha/beta hydrolase [Georgenia sp. TF02-10]|uniref:alpha/beta fold hydrolase n=1 Tax=Georgenia sp. TF02-10 TaxID=2917725 RepID=UPI001FA78166|nr:alpha/beta hydrolase [Georgenia sp. TF02-10]UNX55543.1 alpha/beta hydrolase [Georgenia sp. TF02-10]